MKISKLIKFYFFSSGLVVAWFFGHLMLLLLSAFVGKSNTPKEKVTETRH